MDCKYIWLNGKIMAGAEVQMPFMTPAVHYGMAVFEGIRCYRAANGPAIFRLREHIERLYKSATVLGWRELPFSVGQLIEACLETVQANGLEECYLRPLVYLAGGGWNLNVDAGQAHVGISVWPWNAYLGPEAAERGVRANVSSYTRHHPNVVMTKAKIAGNYPNSFLAKTESVRLGFDEAIMMDAQGLVAECTGANIFIVKGQRLLTPPEAQVLEGITRDTVMILAREMGLEVSAQPLSRDQLYMADEVFVTGTAAEIVGFREIDFRTIGTGRTGPITRKLQQAYQSAVRGELPRSSEWLTYLPRK
ncbi:branched-chain amino acid transaminase [Hyalangium versicolor]|uniref:branched-chain amino acid transaminase n=1 Tax=Hyalangium versicolor TaxID=2861190 RepID=UPI001CCEB063|nr:branched-chain amino acid transaminase [Hyalangium versicolor]